VKISIGRAEGSKPVVSSGSQTATLKCKKVSQMEHCSFPCMLQLVLQTHTKIKWGELKSSVYLAVCTIW